MSSAARLERFPPQFSFLFPGFSAFVLSSLGMLPYNDAAMENKKRKTQKYYKIT